MTIEDLPKIYFGTRTALMRDLAEQALDAGIMPRAPKRADACKRASAGERYLAVLREAATWLSLVDWAQRCGVTTTAIRPHLPALMATGRLLRRESLPYERRPFSRGTMPSLYGARR